MGKQVLNAELFHVCDSMMIILKHLTMCWSVQIGVTKGVELCRGLKSFYMFHELFYRCGIAKYLSGEERIEYEDYLNKSIHVLDIMGMDALKEQYIKITYEKYGIYIEENVFVNLK